MIGENVGELWDVYNRERKKLEKLHTRGDGTRLLPGEYHLVVSVAIFNDKGELLIQKRHKCKRVSPGKWDISAGGSAIKGEDSKEAAIRETKEEIGVDINLDNCKPQITLYDGEAIRDFWIVEKNVDTSKLKLQEEEVSDARWATESEIINMLKSGIFSKKAYVNKILNRYKIMKGSR